VTYVHDRFTDEALEFVRANRRTPFFLYLAYTIPHLDFEVPELGIYAAKPWTVDERAYAAMVSRMDTDVGRLMQLLEELGLEDDTLVLFTSDNGAVERWEGRFDSSGPLRGKKRDLYEGGIRAPLVARWPARLEPGGVNEFVWGFHDILPTFVDLAGGTIPGGLDGISAASVLEGGAGPEGERYFYWEFHENGFFQGVRHGKWKGVRTGLTGTLELYDLEMDPGETSDIAASNPSIVADLESFLSGARVPSPWWPVDGE
jgi:arylsulfatase A-like enzyme